MRGDTGIASTHYCQIPAETANRCAAASGLALVARLVRVIEIRAPCPLAKIARRGRPVTKLAGCSGEERARHQGIRSDDHTSELQSLMRISYAVCCLSHENHDAHQSITLLNTTHQITTL